MTKYGYIYESLPNEGLFVPKTYIGGSLGRGGSKTVYDVYRDDRSMALAVPNRTDSIQIRAKKSQESLAEPQKASMIAELGLLTVDYIGTVGVKQDNIAIKALLMKRFSDMPYEVIDSKTGTYGDGILPNISTTKELYDGLECIRCEIGMLAAAGVSAGWDSLHFAREASEARLFFFDLAGVRQSDKTEAELMGQMASLVAFKLDNVLSRSAMRRLEVQGFDPEARRNLLEHLATPTN